MYDELIRGMNHAINSGDDAAGAEIISAALVASDLDKWQLTRAANELDPSRYDEDSAFLFAEVAEKWFERAPLSHTAILETIETHAPKPAYVRDEWFRVVIAHGADSLELEIYWDDTAGLEMSGWAWRLIQIDAEGYRESRWSDPLDTLAELRAQLKRMARVRDLLADRGAS